VLVTILRTKWLFANVMRKTITIKANPGWSGDAK